MSMIKRCKPLLAKVANFAEINVDFLATESHAFHFDMPPTVCWRSLYGRCVGASEVSVRIAEKLVTVCATMNEFPHVRYHQSSAACTEIGAVFHEKMNAFIADNAEWWYYGGQGHAERERGTLILCDRKDDPLSPIIHEFTYQAMCQDLLPMEEDKISYKPDGKPDDKDVGGEGLKDVLLNDNDELWKELRGGHIADVITTLSARIRNFVSTNSGAALAKDAGADMSLSEMSAALKNLPEYKETMAKLSQHMHLSHMCMDEFNRKNLMEISELEQTMSTGTDAEGKSLKVKELVDDLIDAVAGIGTREMAVRLIMIYIISQQGIKPEDRKRLFDAAGLTEDEQVTILGLEKIGVTLQSAPPKKSVFSTSSMFKRSEKLATGRSDKDSVYAMSRYSTAMKGLLEDVQNGKLSEAEYPSIMPLPVTSDNNGASVRSARRGGGKATESRWGTKAETGKKKFTGGRQIVFVVGGVCYSEIRTAYESMKEGSKEVVIGGTSYVNAGDFMAGLNALR